MLASVCSSNIGKRQRLICQLSISQFTASTNLSSIRWIRQVFYITISTAKIVWYHKVHEWLCGVKQKRQIRKYSSCIARYLYCTYNPRESSKVTAPTEMESDNFLSTNQNACCFSQYVQHKPKTNVFSDTSSVSFTYAYCILQSNTNVSLHTHDSLH